MKRLVEAFFNSIAGIRFGFMREPALREEMVLFLVSVPVALILTQEPQRLLLLWGSLLFVLCVEFLNTGIEKLADRVTRENDDLVKIAKDCGSAAVLMSLLIAAGFWGLAAWEWLKG